VPTPAEAIVEATRPALRRGPCLVSFSGGFDSSIVLAAAVRAARADGLPDPVPITARFKAAPRSEESDWQEAVVRELGVREWIRLDGDDEDFDFVGSQALAVIARHGVLYPANAHFHAAMLERAAGGSLLTGVGGDQLYGGWRWPDAAAVREGRVRPTPRVLARVGRSRLPVAARGAIEQRRISIDLPWLRPEVEATMSRAWARARAAEPASWAGRVRWQVERRSLQLGVDSLARIAADHDALIDHPLAALPVAQAVAAAGPRLGFSRRDGAFRALYGDLVPAALATRRGKATFNEVFVGEATRAAAAAWDGTGLDASLVDPAALASVWREGVTLRTASLLQTLAARG
jgi:asparagine synthase (glutamine-hydrolysing)